jgi:hypothetical protein
VYAAWCSMAKRTTPPGTKPARTAKHAKRVRKSAYVLIAPRSGNRELQLAVLKKAKQGG